MSTPYLTRKGSAWSFQIRIPKKLDPASTLSPLRIPIGAMPARQARRHAAVLNAAAQIAFEKVIVMQRDKSTPAEAVRPLSKQLIASILPMLRGMNALAINPEQHRDPEMVDQIFEVLAVVGGDQSTGTGLFANPRFQPEAPFVATLMSPQIAKAYTGEGNLDGLADTSAMLSSLQSLSAKLEADATLKSAGELFSAVTNGRIVDIMKTKGNDHELVGTYTKVRDEFIAICGDRRVGDYRRADLQHYVNEISWLHPDASSQPGFRFSDVCRHIEQNRKVGGIGLAAKTIRQGRLSYVKAIIALGCGDADIRNRVADARIDIPDRAPLPVARIAPDGKAFEKVLIAGIATGILSDALLPAMALLTGRRIGLLAFLRREDIYQRHGVWVILVRSHVHHNDHWEPVPIKTEVSQELIVVPQTLVDTGFVDWARRASGPIFPGLMACRDPADAAQKRLNRLIKDNTDTSGGEMPWVFHALRHGKIDSDRDQDVDARLIRKQVGHETGDVHNSYGRLTPKQMRKIAAAVPPEDVNWGLLKQIDFEAFSQARPWRRRKPG